MENVNKDSGILGLIQTEPTENHSGLKQAWDLAGEIPQVASDATRMDAVWAAIRDQTSGPSTKDSGILKVIQGEPDQTHSGLKQAWDLAGEIPQVSSDATRMDAVWTAIRDQTSGPSTKDSGIFEVIQGEPDETHSGLKQAWDLAGEIPQVSSDPARMDTVWKTIQDQTVARDSGILELIQTEPNEKQAGLHQAWDLAGEMPQVSSDPARMDAVWKAIQDQTGSTAAPRLRLVPSAIIKWAAAAAVLLAMAVAWTTWDRGLEFEAVAGETLNKTLPDGSEFALNSGSTLLQLSGFGETERKVDLNGEAFFSIKKSDVPFVVETHNARVTVLGTKFNVRARDDAGRPITEVSLESGSVKIEPHNGERAITLNPGESVRVTGESLTETSTNDTHGSWRFGGLQFSDATIAEVLEELERRFEVEIQVEEEISKRGITLTMPNVDTATDALEVIGERFGLQVLKTDNGYSISE